MSGHIVYECYCVLHLFCFNYFMSVRRRWVPVRDALPSSHHDDDDDDDVEFGAALLLCSGISS